MKELPLNTVQCGDCREIMATYPEDSVDLVVTSPPYWGLRDYGGSPQVYGGNPTCEHQWVDKKAKLNNENRQGLSSNTLNVGEKAQNLHGYGESLQSYCFKCGAWRGSLGLEPHPQMFIDHLVEISREIKRVIKPRGSFWLNLGDTYCGSWGSYGNRKELTGKESTQREKKSEYIDRRAYKNTKQKPPSANNFKDSNWLQPKQLLGIPWRVATALQHDGWILRNCVIWYKPNHMPESVRDRLTKSYEFFFFFVKQRKYYFDLDAIREPVQTENRDYLQQDYNGKYKETIDHETLGSPRARYNRNKTPGMNIAEYRTSRRELGLPEGNINGKNPGDVWEVNTHPFPGSHFAVFPPDLIEPIIKSSSPPNGTILDPFAGSGTALRVARKLGRKFIGIELNPEYAAMCERRVRADTYTSPPEGVPTLWEALEK